MKLLYLTAAWVGGLLFGLILNPPIWAVLIPTVALLVIGLMSLAIARRSAAEWAEMKKQRPFTLFVTTLLAALILLGVLRSADAESPPPLVPDDFPNPVRVEGIVTAPPDSLGNSLRFVLQAHTIDTGDGWEEFAAHLLVTARPTPELVSLRKQSYVGYGDRLTLEGAFAEPPILETFDYRDYLARQGIHLVMDFPTVKLQDEGRGSPILTAVYNLRNSLSSNLEQALPEPQAAVARTLLLGNRDNLSPQVRDNFRSTGTSHLLAISGLHVAVVLVLTMAASAFLLGRKGPYFLFVPLLALWGYAILSGMSPSVVRAAIMGTIYLVAVAAGRPRNVFPPLALAAGVMAGLNPGILRDLSFQLSCAAVAGIALLAPSITDWLQDKLRLTHERHGFAISVARGALLSAVVSLAATLATLPLVAFHFQQLPTFGIPATVLALPALPPILLTSALTATAHSIHPALGQIIGWTAYIPVTYLTSIVQAVAAIPGGLIEMDRFSGLLVWLYYLPLALTSLTPWHTLTGWGRKTASLLPPLSLRSKPANLRLLIPAAALFLFATIAWTQALSEPDGRLHVIFLDVDQGDSILIVTPSEQRVLVDGGPDPVEAVRVLNDHIPFWDRRLDLLVSTHTDGDHLTGLVGVAQRHPIGTVVEGILGASSLYLRWQQALTDKSINPIAVHRGASIHLGDGLTLQVLNPALGTGPSSERGSNNSSVVLRLKYGDVSFLLTGDIEEEVESELLRE